MHDFFGGCLPVLALFVVICQLVATFPELNSARTTHINITYHWTTGPWGSCYTPHMCGEGRKTREIWCTDSEGFKALEMSCDDGHRPTTEELCFRACSEHRHLLRWRTDEWGTCERRNPSSTGPCREAPGIARRSVTCLYHPHPSQRHRQVEDAACEFFESKPPSAIPCTAGCPQDCVVGPYGPWLPPCSDSACGARNRTRFRPVLVAPTDKGLPCPPIQEVSNCPAAEDHSCMQQLRLEAQIRYFLKLGSWSDCLPLDEGLPSVEGPTRRPAVGYRTRNITCISSLGDPLDVSFCWSAGLRVSMPVMETCIVSVNCMVTPWSPWSTAEEGCITSDGRIIREKRVRRRKVERLAEGRGRPCPPLTEILFVNSNLPPCEKHKWLPTDWGGCVIIQHGAKGKVEVLHPLCGSGIQQRNIICVRTGDLVPVAEFHCKELRPPTIQPCFRPCPRDCEVSQWSRWGPCLPLDTSDPFELPKAGYQERSREVVVQPTPDASECPALQEVELCDRPQLFVWQVGNWSRCRLTNKSHICGDGIRSREAICLKINGTPVGEAMCHIHIPPPEVEKRCYIPCPRDCVLSEWSPWSVCSVPCSTNNQGGLKTRNRTILAPPGPGGKPCPSDQELVESDICNQDSCTGFHWQGQLWKPCRPFKDKVCGLGSQEREIWCVYDKEMPVSDRKCYPIQKPIERRDCEVPCSQDCELTKFSDWSPCPDSCDIEATQHRERFILHFSQHDGAPCPQSLREVRVCSSPNELLCNNLQVEKVAAWWEIGLWSECILPDEVKCGMGYRRRKVACLQSDGKEVEPSACLHWNASDKAFSDLAPAAVQTCFRSCDTSCVISEWSAWSPCDTNCRETSFRRREILGDAEMVSVCSDKHHLQEERPCLRIQQMAVSSSHWLDCIVTDNDTVSTSNGLVERGKCGKGLRYKRGSNIDLDTCTEKGMQEDVCLVDCPVDCEMSSWSDWTPCNITCGSGYRTRYRSMITPSVANGRPCPAMINKTEVETDACTNPCSQFQWMLEGWSQCELLDSDEQQVCGKGIRSRHISCYKVLPGQAPMEVNEAYCDPALRPKSKSNCRIPCPDECVVSEWSHWSSCSEPCPRQIRQRTRIVLRSSVSTDTSSCPPLVEKDKCILNQNCFHYVWLLGSWGSCVLPVGAFCGKGQRRRSLICQRSDGRHVDPRNCLQVAGAGSALQQLEMSCYIDCPIDCEASEWSSWDTSKCNECQSTGHMTRTRRVIQEPTSAGQPCPQQLLQKKICPYRPCYHWVIGEWSKCDLQGATCGHGSRSRSIECHHFKMTVSNHLCFLVNLTMSLSGWLDLNWLTLAQGLQEEELCSVPCPGDCQLSSWSEWSNCHRDCSAGHVVGYQTRSRGIIKIPNVSSGETCPKELWEQRPCWSGICLSFTWQVINDSVYCVRSDGLLVQGGCRWQARPCHPPCSAAHSTCDHATGQCVCLAGFRPIHASSHAEEVQLQRRPLQLVNPSRHVEAIRGGTGDLHLRLLDCQPLDVMDASGARNFSSSQDVLSAKYFPDDSEISFWMYAMISVGTAFVIFVGVTIYLMCHSTIRQRVASVRRQASVRRRPHNFEDPASPYKTYRLDESFNT